MIHLGDNKIDGITIKVVKKKRRKISLSLLNLNEFLLVIPNTSTLSEGDDFLKKYWQWVLARNGEGAAYYKNFLKPITKEELKRLEIILSTLNAKWAERTAENGVKWGIRNVKTYWGNCNYKKRYISYNAKLARAPIEIIEYVVIHEFTHLLVHNHGPEFQAIMDKRLPNWKDFQYRLKHLNW